MGAMLGFTLTCGYLVVKFLLDDKVKSADDITKLTGLPVLAEVPVFSLKNNVKRGWDYANSGEINFFTDLSLAKVLNLLNKVRNSDSIGSYVITGPYQTALEGWNFTFTDQANRIEVIKQVYGIEVPELPYISYEYTKWLMDEGFTSARYIAVARDILEQAGQVETMTEAQQAALNKLQAALDAAVLAFDAAADSMSADDQKVMVEKRRELRSAGDEAAVLLTGKDAPWSTGKYWYADPMINEYQYSWQ